jgi:hypothetical protein
MKEINLKTPMWKLTVGEFLEISKDFIFQQKYEYGLKGLAKILGCSISKASEIKSSGILDEAIIQKGNIIIIDIESFGAFRPEVICITLN